MNTQAKPLFLFDVDGVANAFNGWVLDDDAAVPHKVAPEGYYSAWANGYTLLLNKQMPEWIAEIKAAGFDMVWATMWQDQAPKVFSNAAQYGHDWDYVDFHSFHNSWAWKKAGMTGLGVGGYKAPGIESVAGDTPAVWVDDDLQPENYAWAAAQNAAGIPTLLIKPNPKFGMTYAQVQEVLAFAAQFETTVPATA